MITKDGKFVPTVGNKGLGYRVRQPILEENGRTLTHCAVCGDKTPLLYESYILVGSVDVATTKGRFNPDNGYRWEEETRHSRRPIQKKVWVCERHYNNRTGKPIIPVTERVDERFSKAEVRAIKDQGYDRQTWKDNPLTAMHNRVKAMRGQRVD